MMDGFKAFVCRSVAALGAIVLLPALASAQATLAGTVTDTSGAVLPGVTIEATSPVLIERVRTAVSDGTGQYRIAELPPGDYTVTFTLAGFSVVARPGVQVSGVGVITIDAILQVGALEETITVTGETPIVDVQSSRRGTTLNDDVIKSLPATRGYNAIVFLVPSVTGGSNQVDLMPAMRIFYSHGGRGNEGRVQVDGLNIGAAFNGGGVSGYVSDTANAEELAFTLSGGLGEAEVGGTLLNVIPKTGGNLFAGTVFGSTAGEWSQGSNLDQELINFGIQDQPALVRNWDVSGSLGGPLRRDRVWFFGTYRDFGTFQEIPGGYANLNQGDPTSWSYAPDLNVPTRGANQRTIMALRLTTQVTPRNKVGIYWDEQLACDGSAMIENAGNCRSRGKDWIANGTATTAPEAASGGSGGVGAAGYGDTFQRVVQGTWTSPVTSRLLLEAGWSTYVSRWGWMAPPGAVLNLNQVNEQSTGFTYRGLDWNFNRMNWNTNWRASASYVTGAHSMKFGYQHGYDLDNGTSFYNDTRLNYRFNNGVPNRLTMNLGNWFNDNRTNHFGLYAQDQWTHGQMTLQGAVRYERAWSYFPEGQGWDGPDLFHADPIVFPRVEGVPGFNDIMARVGAAYDVFGNGRTSVKVNLGKYVQSANNQDRYTTGNPANSFSRTTNRTWIDANGNYLPDCDLMNPVQNGECGAWQTPGFGSPLSVNAVNPAILEGWGVRPADWQFGVSIQHEVLPRTSVEIGYNRRWFQGFTVTDNRAVTAADFDQFTFTAPMHPELPNGGGYAVSAFNINPAAATRIPDNYVTFSSDYGNQSAYWHGVDVNVNSRLANGVTIQGGTSTGRGVRDNCDVVAVLPEILGTQQAASCRVVETWQTQVRGLAQYVVPVIDVQLGVNFQFKPGTLGLGGNDVASNGNSLAANYPVPSAVAEQTLGRPLSNNATNQTVNLLLPGQQYGDRVNQVDLRLAKLLTFRRTRTQIGFDIYNLFNANPILGYNQSFGPRWLAPTQILQARFVRFNATVDF